MDLAVSVSGLDGLFRKQIRKPIEGLSTIHFFLIVYFFMFVIFVLLLAYKYSYEHTSFSDLRFPDFSLFCAEIVASFNPSN